MKDDAVPDIPVPRLPLALIPIALLGWFSRRAEPEAPAGAAMVEDQA
ncbi:hypothetical protein MKP05_14130 [Halomonas sp. EGI 63088]|uniref:Uncharacterized protein n=1 Tax=Halomonas flagellata TaxID=2920385 RepID=A0ABS9RWP6_9GAMM|nr:hypothetical protein [Halomonas flagellata]MCH4564249.1 hypothetical protein [Halomonas flagellata]